MFPPRRIHPLSRLCHTYIVRHQPKPLRWNIYQRQLRDHNQHYCSTGTGTSTTISTGSHCRRYDSSASYIDTNHPQNERSQKIKVCYLDLRGFGISILERLMIEECILKHDPERRHWIICGTHTATPHKYLQLPLQIPPVAKTDRHFISISDMDDYDVLESTATRNDAVAIVMGIGGKPHDLLNIESVQRDHVSVIKRFTGGGTVILDHNSIWTTIIGRPVTATVGIDNGETIKYYPQQPLHHPKPIMEYTANTIYKPIFDQLTVLHEQKQLATHSTSSQLNKTLILDSKSCSLDNSGRVLTIPLNRTKSERAINKSSSSSYAFALRENDYVVHHTTTQDTYKMGGNAQAITKDGFLHHTSFLWDYETYNMEEYLLLPKKRPVYRKDRNHTSFLISLQTIYPSLQKNHFFTTMQDTCREIFDVQRMSFTDVMKTIIDAQGGIQSWYETQSRTKTIQNL